ncbi:EAL and HDOD domain-containing protein [Sulfuricurvum sp.]|uniref:EAL and HDOD domain-containing protein n=1 Tax=Sulfuricurvum sp. TaxID=2025608 RepID=UPI002D71C3B0|nr:EAL domain-containing protein [Sulfuricurvum sp.]HZF70826.1 EAL domain-containing protein [Sulfuricurvum sp.]
MDDSIYLARQPIFNEVGDIFAYELLYRNTENNSADVYDNLHATSRVLVNTLNYIGLNTLTYGLKAFVKVDDKILMDDVVHAVSAAYFVLEILESTIITPELIERIYALHMQGYRFALNHYSSEKEFIRHFHSLIEVIDYIKIDTNHPDGPDRILASLKNYECKFIAEKIEDEESFERAKSYGFHYFQGYYFSVPDLLAKENFDPDNTLLLDLIYLLKTNASLEKLMAAFDTSPYLTINLLKFIQINEGLIHDSISSIEQALLLIGRERLSSWLELMYYADAKSDASKNNTHAMQITQQALQRAYFMEELAHTIKRSTHFSDMAYITGMLSISEIMFHESYRKLMEQITIDTNIITALLEKKGVIGRLLELSIAIEKNNLSMISSIILELDLSERELNKCLLNSYRRSAAALNTNVFIEKQIELDTL